MSELDPTTIESDKAHNKTGNKKRKFIACFIAIIIIGLLIPEQHIIPVQNATNSDWNHKTFWYDPWGASGVHKGIDIFAKADTPALGATSGVVMFSGHLKRGGVVIAILGPKWRVHYYAHLNSTNVYPGQIISSGDVIGTVGDSGNAKGKQPHLHYSILTLVPYIWRVDFDRQGWKKMFYLNPHKRLKDQG